MTGAALAQGLTPKAAAENRVNRYREVGAAFKTINDQAKSGTLIKMTARIAARTISAAARDQYQWFPAGSGPESGAKTKAKTAIWSDAAGFKKAQTAFAQQSDLMTKAVETGNISAVQTRAKLLGATCSACHRNFREE
ncbi:c-type cytochrome [Sphingobium tyrosinilyticum]|uniref:C-type cytochrome n=2 Tax=Sphingobium tyrosinilyticum TaxID=2715436 RepID=A0ABV9F1T5_9SPHN